MPGDRKTTFAEYQNHRSEVEKRLFRVIQEFSEKENMTAADVNALAALSEALISVHKMI